MVATQILTEALGDSYDIKVVLPIEAILGDLDPVKTITMGRCDGEGFYNILLQKGYNRCLNAMIKWQMGTQFFLSHGRLQRRFRRLFAKERPDMVISVMPLINSEAADMAAELKIPFLCTTLDGNLALWLNDMENCVNKNVHFTVLALTANVEKQLQSAGINKDNVHVVGPLAKKEFFEEKDATAIRKAWNFPAEKPIVMIMMGGQGVASQLKKCAKALIDADLDVHLAICVGRNQEAARQVQRLSSRCKRTSLTVIPFTNKVSDLMHVADLFISKPGGQTCAEAIAMGLPMLLDKTHTWLFLERRNIDWLTPKHLGSYFKRYSELPELVKSHLGTRDRSLSLKTPPHDALKSLVLSLLPVKH